MGLGSACCPRCLLGLGCLSLTSACCAQWVSPPHSPAATLSVGAHLKGGPQSAGDPTATTLSSWWAGVLQLFVHHSPPRTYLPIHKELLSSASSMVSSFLCAPWKGNHLQRVLSALPQAPGSPSDPSPVFRPRCASGWSSCVCKRKGSCLCDLPFFLKMGFIPPARLRSQVQMLHVGYLHMHVPMRAGYLR